LGSRPKRWFAIRGVGSPKGTPGVFTISSGNHSQGIARAAAERGLLLVLPFDHPEVIAGKGNTSIAGA
jgi:threonine dehydratase